MRGINETMQGTIIAQKKCTIWMAKNNSQKYRNEHERYHKAFWGFPRHVYEKTIAVRSRSCKQIHLYRNTAEGKHIWNGPWTVSMQEMPYWQMLQRVQSTAMNFLSKNLWNKRKKSLMGTPGRVPPHINGIFCRPIRPVKCVTSTTAEAKLWNASG